MEGSSSKRTKLNRAVVWVKSNIDELHLYSDKREFAIKGAIWGASWLGGIRSVYMASEKESFSAAFFIFSLSLLMEFTPNFKKNNLILSRLVFSLFYLALGALLFMAMATLFGEPFCQSHYSIMYDISKGIMIYMAIDLLVTIFEADHANYDSKTSNKPSTEAEERTAAFMRKKGAVSHVNEEGGKGYNE